MHWLLFSENSNPLVKQCADLLQVVGQIVSHQYGVTSFEQIKQTIKREKPDRIIVITNGDASNETSPLVDILGTHLLVPFFVGQATMNCYSPTPVLVLTCTTGEKAFDSTSSVDLVQNAAEELIRVYPNLLTVRLFTPICDKDLNQATLFNHCQSVWKTNDLEEVHHVTIVSDLLPILLGLIHDGKAFGQVDVCNRGTITLRWLEGVLEKSTGKGDFDRSSTTDWIDPLEKLNKHLISPETRQLYQAEFLVPNAAASIQAHLREQSIQSNPNTPKIILVTGGYGFIGSTFINHWLTTYPNDKIVNIDRLDPVANTKNIEQPNSSNYSAIIADISNKDIVLHLMHQYNITHIVHFAVQAHLDSSFGNSITFTESNVYGTHSVLEASRISGKIQKFIHISTDEVYGESPAGSHRETNLLNPINPYAATIAAAEFLVKSYGESFKLPFCIIRLSNVYGPRQHIEKVIPTFIQNLSQGRTLQIHGDGTQIRYYTYVDDVIRAIEVIFNKGKSKMIYNIGTEHGLTVLEIAKTLLQKLQPKQSAEQLLHFGKGRIFTEKRYASTLSGAAKTLGWQAQVSFDEGLEKTIQWYRDNQNYWSK